MEDLKGAPTMPQRAAPGQGRQQVQKPSQSLLTRDQSFGSAAGAVVGDAARVVAGKRLYPGVAKAI
jgi:hypothetical protein